MKKWELARYIIDSKKVIDSIAFIDDNIDKISNLDLYEIITSKLRLFYIDLSVVYDDWYKTNKIKKSEHKEAHLLIKRVFYERDKYYAHKDTEYQKKEYSNIKELIKELKASLEYCLKICHNSLPDGLTLDYISYDRNLFRFIKNITPQKENKIKKLPSIDSFTWPMEERSLKIFNDIEDIKYIKNKYEYAVAIESGINLFEGLQNRQDFCIKVNVLFDENIWVNVKNISELRDYEEIFEDIIEKLSE